MGHHEAMKAFSLIEVMIASAMLGIGLAALMTAHGTAAGLSTHQERVTAALHLAEGQMENLLLRFPDSSDLSVGAAHGPITFSSAGQPTGTPFYSLSWTVSPGPIPRTRRVDVTVNWTEGQRAQTLTLTTHRS
jgi:prepilin-type N-terminal cleavage/methylation domain-containing protein